MSYEVGSKARSTVTVKDLSGALADATMSIVVSKPDGTVLSPAPTITHDSTGVYYAEFVVDQVDTWTIVWSATGAVVGTFTNQLSVRAPGRRIVSIADVKLHLNKDLTTTTDDDELRGFIDAAQEVIEGITGPVVATSAVELYNGSAHTVVLRRRPVQSVTLVREILGGMVNIVVAESGSGTGFDYLLDAGRGLLHRRTNLVDAFWYAGYVEVTYVAGRVPIPGNIRLAALEEVGHLWRNSQLASGGARAAAGASDVLSSLAFSMPRRVEELLKRSERSPRQGG